MNNSTNTTLKILIALIVGIMIGTYIPKIIKNQSSPDQNGKAINTQIIQQEINSVSAGNKKNGAICNASKCDGNGACYFWMDGTHMNVGAYPPSSGAYITGTQNGSGMCYQ